MNLIQLLFGIGAATLPMCGDTKEKAAELLGRPDSVHGSGAPMPNPPWRTEWVYLNARAKLPFRDYDREAHWKYLVRFGDDGLVIGVDEAVRGIEGYSPVTLLKCGP